MSSLEKLIKKVLSGSQVSYENAERILLFLGFSLTISSSHHIFRKSGYGRIVMKTQTTTHVISNKRITGGFD